MMLTKSAHSVSIALILSIFLSGCSSSIAIPDVAGSDVDTAKAVISSLGLVPTVEEEYSEFIASGLIIRTDPKNGEQLSAGSKILLVLSKGPRRVETKNSTLEWTNLTYGQDKWEFTAPYIEDDTLNIDFSSVVFKAKVEWKDEQENGYGFGQAAINDTFDKAVPLKILYKKQTHSAGQKQDFTVQVPLSDLNESKPTTMYLQLVALVNGYEQDINLTLTATW
jgi:hypothetical protein